MSGDIDIIEQMFEYSHVSPAITVPHPSPNRQAIARLQERIRSLETPGVEERVFPLSEHVQTLFPEGGLRRGVVYQCDLVMSLVWTLLAEASSQGVWCALVGIPDAGLAAAEDMGVTLDRLVLVPHPGDQWLSVVSALSDVVGIVVLGGVPAPSERTLSTLMGRLRERESTLLVGSSWPRQEAAISVSQHQWRGLGSGHGLLQTHRMSVTVTPRYGHSSRSTDVLIDAHGFRSDSSHASVIDLARYRRTG